MVVLVVKNPSNEDMGHYECEVSSERFKDLLCDMTLIGEFILLGEVHCMRLAAE